MSKAFLALPLLLAMGLPAWAGTAELRFTDPQAYSDGGASPAEREAARAALTDELGRLARRLPAGRMLSVEVLDLQLAGTSRPRADGRELRVLRGRADFPVLKIRWQLSQGGQPMATGEEQLKDLDYSRGLPYAADPNRSFHFERQLLDRWFDRRIAAASAG